MSSRVFRHNRLCACSTCGLEWFGKGGEASARRHAVETGHQVQIEILHQETINAVREDGDPEYLPTVLSPVEVERSVELARERVSLFERPLMRSGRPNQGIAP